MADTSITDFVEQLTPSPDTGLVNKNTRPTVGEQNQVMAGDGDVEQAILSGQYSFPKNKRIDVVDPSGQSFNLPGDQVPDALKQGFRIETAREKSVREAVAENDNITGSIKVAAKQFVNQALFEIPEIVSDAVSDPFDIEKSNAIKKDHAFANAVGGIAGFGTSLATGAPLFKGATKAASLAEKIVAKKLANLGVKRGSTSLAKDIVARTAENAARLGVEGAIVSTPRAITETVLGDPEAGAEALLMGGFLGAGLGLAAGPAGKAIETLRPKTGSVVKGLENLRNERVAKALGFTKGQIKKLKGGQDEAEEVAEHIFNSKLADGNDIIGATSTTEDIANNLQQFKNEAGEKIGQTYKVLDETGQTVKTYDFAKFIDNEVGSAYQGNLNKEERNILNGVMEDVLALGPEVSFSSAKKFLDDIGKVAYPGGKRPLNPTPKQAVARELWGKMRGYIDEAAETAVKSSGDNALYEGLLSSRRDYSTATKAMKAIEDKISSESGNKLFGLTDTITGATTAAAGGPGAAILSVLAKKTAEKYGNVVAADLLDKSIDGVLSVAKFMNKAQAKINEIPGAIASISRIADVAAPSVAKGTSAIARIIGDDEMPKRQAYNTLQDKISSLIANPSLLADNIAMATSPLSETGAPNVANSVNQKISQTLQYIQDNMPKSGRVPNPFYEREYIPSESELSKFERKMEVILNPFVVIDSLKNGTLTKEHMGSLAANYPVLYQAIRSRVLSAITDEKHKFPYQSRLKLSLLMGLDVDGSTSPQSVQSYQNAFAIPSTFDNNGDELSQSGLNKMDPGKTELTQAQAGLVEK